MNYRNLGEYIITEYARYFDLTQSRYESLIELLAHTRVANTKVEDFQEFFKINSFFDTIKFLSTEENIGMIHAFAESFTPVSVAESTKLGK